MVLVKGLVPMVKDVFPTIRNILDVTGTKCWTVLIPLTVSILVSDGRGLQGLLIITNNVRLRLLLLNSSNALLEPAR